MGEKGVGKLSRETPPPCEGEPMGAKDQVIPIHSATTDQVILIHPVQCSNFIT